MADEFARPPRPWPTDSNGKPQSIIKVIAEEMKQPNPRKRG